MAKIGKFLVIDTETTGLDIFRHSLIQLAGACLDNNLEIAETFCEDVKPKGDFKYTPEALEVNGFNLERIRNGKNSLEVCKSFIQFCERNFETKPIFVGQFYPFDFAVVNKFFGENELGEEWIKWFGNEFIDTKALVLTANYQAEKQGKPLPFPVTSLTKPNGLCEKFGITGHQAHDALGDVLATREVLKKLLEFLDVSNRAAQ